LLGATNSPPIANRLPCDRQTIYKGMSIILKIDIPSWGNLRIENVVFDYNGTLACSGIIAEDIKSKLLQLVDEMQVNVYVITADTFGSAREQLGGTGVKVHIISHENGSEDKLQFVSDLGAETCVAIGNGNNDALMIRQARLGICILGCEGCATKAFIASDIAVTCIEDALGLLLDPMKLKATLRG